MNIFKNMKDINYNDILQLDGAFSVSHMKYTKQKFNDNEELIENIESFDGTIKDLNFDDKIKLWEKYWLEYVNAFSILTDSLPNSIVTIFIGRQAIEIGFKYLLLNKTKQVTKGHSLEKLSGLLFSEYEIKDSYMNFVYEFCKNFEKYIEGGNVEYFKYPEYSKNTFFAGIYTDMTWLSYNLALILLKLIHFANLDEKF